MVDTHGFTKTDLIINTSTIVTHGFTKTNEMINTKL